MTNHDDSAHKISVFCADLLIWETGDVPALVKKNKPGEARENELLIQTLGEGRTRWFLAPSSAFRPWVPFCPGQDSRCLPALQPDLENSSVRQIRFIQRPEGTPSQFSLQKHSLRCGLHTDHRLEMSAHVGTGTSSSSGPTLQSWAWIPFPLISFLFPLSYFLPWLRAVFPFHPADMWGHSLPNPTLPHIWKSHVHIWTPSSSGRSLLTFFSLKLNPCNLLLKGPLNHWNRLHRLRKKALDAALRGGIYDLNQIQHDASDGFFFFLSP